MNGSSMTGTVTAYRIDGGVFATAELSGTVSEQGSITATFRTSYNSTGSISLAFNDIYNRDSSLALTAGVWSYSDGTDSLSVTVGDDGAFFGQDSDGCVISGRLSILDAAYNLYDVDVQVATCGSLNGSYHGFAGFLDETAPNDTLQFAVSNSNYVILYPLTRQ